MKQQKQPEIVIVQDYLNQLPLMVLFLLSVYALIRFSPMFPWSVQWLDLWLFYFPLPLFGIFPLMILAVLTHALFDKRMVLTDEYLNFIEGRVSWKEKTIRVGYEHIREIEIDQTIYQRIVGIGDIGITAIATTLEPTIIMPGIRKPRVLKDTIRERMHALEDRTSFEGHG